MLSEELDNKEDYNLVIEGNNLRLTYSHDYISIEDYLLDSIIYKQLFNNITYNSDKNEISLETGNIFNLSTSELNNSYNIKILQINVNTPFKVTDENADITSENTYSWTIDKDTKEKELYITFDKESATLNRGTIILIITIVLVIIILIIFAVKRLLQSRKI